MTVEHQQAFDNVRSLSKDQLLSELFDKFGNSYGYQEQESTIILTRHGNVIVNINFKPDNIQVLAENPHIRTNEETVPVFELVKKLAS